MDHDSKQKRPNKKQTPIVYGDYRDDNWFSLADALWNPGVSVGTLATFIENNDIKAIDPMYRVIAATDGDEHESTSKACALKLLVLFCAENDAYHERDPSANPSRWQEYGSPMHKFGWIKNEVPDDPDVFAEWINNSISESETNSSIKIYDTNLNDLKEEAIQAPDTSPAINVESDIDETLSDLFDPVTVAALEKMFPADGKWKGWAERASRNKLIDARKGRGTFNPYKAAMWFVGQGIEGWNLARCNRVLANNLPARSQDEKHLFASEPD